MTHLRARNLASLGLGLGLALALVACGGKSKPAGTGPHASGGGGKPPFDQEAVKALIEATAAADADGCAVEGAATIGDAMRIQRGLLEQDGKVEDGFHCKASVLAEGRWECTLEVARAPSGGDDDEGTAFQAIGQVDSDGVLLPGQLLCVAPG